MGAITKSETDIWSAHSAMTLSWLPLATWAQSHECAYPDASYGVPSPEGEYTSPHQAGVNAAQDSAHVHGMPAAARHDVSLPYTNFMRTICFSNAHALYNAAFQACACLQSWAHWACHGSTQLD